MSLILSTFVLTACGGATAPAGSQSPGSASSTPDASGPGAVPVPSAPVIDVDDLVGSMSAAELALRAQTRERAGLVNLGPGALGFAAAMDASEARVLAKLGADLAGLRGSLAGQIAAVGPIAAPEPGFNGLLVWALLVSALDDLARNPGSGTVEDRPETVEVAGNTGTITTTTSYRSVTSSSQLSVDLTIKTKGQVVDRATGAVLFGIDSIATGHIDVDFCPDSAGKSIANVKLTSSEIYTGGAAGSGRGIANDFSGNVVITVGDDANIANVDGTAQGSEDSRGGVPPAGSSESDLPTSSGTASDNIANDGRGHRRADVPRNYSVGGQGATSGQLVALYGTMSTLVESMVTAAAKEAEKLWREGKCVELIVDPTGGDVEPDEVKDVTAKLKHKIEGNELDKPVVAKMTGVKSVEPEGTKQPAPATVRFTAGPKEDDFGEIAFESVSNRGIAKKSVRFTVRSTAWTVAFTGNTTQVANAALGPEKVALKATITDLRVTPTDGRLSGTGKLHLKGTHTAGCFKGTLDQVVPIKLDGELVGTGPEAVLRVSFSRPSASTGKITMSCPKIATWDFPDAGYSELFWFVIGTVDLPAAGGRVAFDRTAVLLPRTGTVTGTFTVTKVPR